MAFELDLGAIRRQAKNTVNSPWLMANVANVANVANEKQPNSPKPLATLAGLATLAISHGAKRMPAPAANDPGHAALLELALAYCTQTGASDKARQDWRQDVADTPPALRGDLYLYLREQLQGQRRPAPAPARPAPPAPAPAPGWLHMSQPWRVADRAYEAHHWQCHTCRAAARGHSARCAAGQTLHSAYTQAAQATTKGLPHD